jgi:nucleoside-diphosphate-sugar epimerase
MLISHHIVGSVKFPARYGGDLKIFISGASGFLGKHLVGKLLQKSEYEITCLSRVEMSHNNKIDWIRGDLNDNGFLDTVDLSKYDKLFHLAWEGLPDRSEVISRKNFNLSANFIKKFAKYDKLEVNVIGSGLEYGDLKGVVTDTDHPTGGNEFARAKISLHEYVQSLGIRYRWFRPFYMYGQGQSVNSLIPTLISNLKGNLPIQIKSINSSHDFVAVEDVANAIVMSSETKDAFGVFNIGTGVVTPVGAIVDLFHKMFGVNSNVQYKVSSGLASKSDRLRKLAKWSPEFVGITGIQKYFSDLDFKV